MNPKIIAVLVSIFAVFKLIGAPRLRQNKEFFDEPEQNNNNLYNFNHDDFIDGFEDDHMDWDEDDGNRYEYLPGV